MSNCSGEIECVCVCEKSFTPNFEMGYPCGMGRFSRSFVVSKCGSGLHVKMTILFLFSFSGVRTSSDFFFVIGEQVLTLACQAVPVVVASSDDTKMAHQIITHSLIHAHTQCFSLACLSHIEGSNCLHY